MSNQTTDDLFDMPPPAKDAKELKPARKTAAKKTAIKKTAAKKVAKKAAKKAVAKKATVKKIAKKLAAKIEQPAKKEESASPPEQTSPKPAAKKAAPAAAKVEKKENPAPIEAPQPLAPPPPKSAPPAAQQEESQPRENVRIGRVPGGGPVKQQSSPQQQQNQQSHQNQDDGQQQSRSKKRREKRKRRRQEPSPQGGRTERVHRNDRDNRDNRQQEDRSATVLSGPITEANGILELAPKGFGFLRMSGNNYEQLKEDIFISPEFIRRYSLRHGQWLHGKAQDSTRGPQLVELDQVNGMPPESAAKLPHFDELKAINPDKRIAFETTPERYTTRVVDIVAPVGRGQRGLIVSPPRSGKTTLLLHMAEAIQEKYDEKIHLMILLVDERPEEVTEFRRALPEAEVYASSNDEPSRNHTRIAELAIERAKRLVEAGKDVFLLMDSITRLARAYNSAMSSGKGRGRGTGSGGITIGALETPRRLFAAARNTREAGSLTILATALIQTNSRADEAIYMEFKGTGNMELVLDRKIAESYIYPAVDIFRSGTRREELLLPEHTLHKIHLIRRGLSGHRPFEAMERLLYFIKKFPNNPQMLLEIKG